MNDLKGPFDGRPLAFFGALFALMLASTNLRGGLVVIGPLVEDIRSTLSISAASFGLLMTLPLICFGLVSLAVPWLASKVSPIRVVLAALLLVIAGASARLAYDYNLMLAGTLLLGTGIALMNVLIPGLVKGLFPKQAGALTGLYTLVLTLGAFVAVLSAIPLRNLFANWQAPMLLWALLPVLATLLWLPMLRVRFQPKTATALNASVWRLKKAWALALFMGLQSTVFYVMATWLPRLLMDNGASDIEAGVLTSVYSLVGIPAALLTPIIASRMNSQRPLNTLIILCGLASLTGLLLAPSSAPFLWASLLGIYGGASISLALVLFAIKSHDMKQATALSSMAQGVGYLFASMGPSLIGALYDQFQAWTIPLGLLILITVLQGLSGRVICAPGTVDEPH